MSFLSGFIFVQEVTKALPNIEENLGGVLAMLVSAFQGGDWFLVGGLVVMVAVWATGRFLPLKSKWLPLVAVGLGMVAGVLTSYINDADWLTALYKGLLTSGEATLFWTMFGKKVLPTKKEESKPNE